MNVYDHKYPTIFKIASFLIFVIWLAIFTFFAWLAYVTVTSGVEPEDVGSFFGRIANGFQKEMQ